MAGHKHKGVRFASISELNNEPEPPSQVNEGNNDFQQLNKEVESEQPPPSEVEEPNE